MNRDYEDHLDFKMLTPKRLTKPLLLTAHIFIPIVAIAIWKGFYVLACFLFPIYFTSLWHWSDPKITSWARTIDVIAVLSGLCCSTYTSFLLQREITILWCTTVLFQAFIFAVNYFLFLNQVEKPNIIVQDYIKEKLKDDGIELDFYDSFIDEHKHYFESVDNKSYINLQPTWPMTREREHAYCRTVNIHMVCVHIIPCLLAIYCLIFGERQ